MDIDALRGFIAFVDTGSFTRAAKQTFRSQSAISMQMKKLESDIGQRLFIKDGRHLGLTDHGQQLVGYARRLLTLHDEAMGHFKHGTQHPPLTIGCPDDYAESILPKVVSQIRTLLPQQSLRVVCDCSTVLRLMLDRGEVDVAILTRAPDVEEGYLLKHDSGVWVHGGDDTVLDQRPLPLILYEPDCKFHSAALDGLDKRGHAYWLLASTSSATAIKSLLRQNMGISAMAVSSVSHGLHRIEHADLPPLPSVDIVLSVAPVAHTAFGSHMANIVCQRFMQDETH